jgi:hypothetical protein
VSKASRFLTPGCNPYFIDRPIRHSGKWYSVLSSDKAYRHRQDQPDTGSYSINSSFITGKSTGTDNSIVANSRVPEQEARRSRTMPNEHPAPHFHLVGTMNGETRIGCFGNVPNSKCDRQRLKLESLWATPHPQVGAAVVEGRADKTVVRFERAVTLQVWSVLTPRREVYLSTHSCVPSIS